MKPAERDAVTSRKAAEAALDKERAARGVVFYGARLESELALQVEFRTWVAAYGSKALCRQFAGAVAEPTGRTPGEGGGDTRWSEEKRERLEQLKPTLSAEWLAHNRPGWIAWRHSAECERDTALLDEWRSHRYRTNDPDYDWHRTPAPHVVPPDSRLFPEQQTAPMRALLAAARSVESTAVLAFYSDAGDRVCALAEARFPGERESAKIVLREDRLQRQTLDAIAKELRGPKAELRTPAERLARVAQLEFKKPVAAVPTRGKLVGRLERIEIGADHRCRALIVGNEINVVSVLPGSHLERHIGQDVTLEKIDGRVRITPVVERSREPELEMGR